VPPYDDAGLVVTPDLWALYDPMLRSRLFEEAVTGLWNDGLIAGEMHLGTGEEAVVAGIVAHLRDGDAMALDHRGTPPLLMRGVDPLLILRELLGRDDGLCRGMGGHMHMFSRTHLAASSGIVGAAGPAAVGFALAGARLRPGSVAIAFFGDAALNQGMLMEAMNLASAWKLPVLFVCKDDGWGITTRSADTTGGGPGERARGLGVAPVEVDGLDVASVWEAAGAAIERARRGGGPQFLHARCVHLEGHFLGFQLLEVVRNPFREGSAMAGELARAIRRPGGPLRARLKGVGALTAALVSTIRDPRRDAANDPVRRARSALEAEPERLAALEDTAARDTVALVESAIGEARP
jgi:pyruvate dehydrogenase E1 component alpha subunit